MAETQEDRLEEAVQAAESVADDLEERGDKVDEHIGQAKKRWDDAQSSEGVPSASADWEDDEPDDDDADPGGFDDPENLDDDEDEDSDDE